MKSLKSWLGLAAAMTLASAPLAAKADLQLCLDDGAGGLDAMCIMDGSAQDANGMDGAITFIGAYGAFTLNVSTALGSPAYQGGLGMDLASLNSSAGAGSLIISMSQNNMQYGSGGNVAVNGFIGGTSWGNVGYQLYADDSNTLFGQGALLASGSANGPAFAAAGGDVFATDDGVFSLTSIVTITHRTWGNTSFDFEAKVPEPGTVTLLGLGLLGAVGVSRRRKAARG